ncbi:hypothetical protein [Kitasatospora sp. NPDC017646]
MTRQDTDVVDTWTYCSDQATEIARAVLRRASTAPGRWNIRFPPLSAL